MKAAASELGELRSSLEGEAFSLEVLCSKMMKRKTLYLCTADPQNPVSVPARDRAPTGSQRAAQHDTPQQTTGLRAGFERCWCWAAALLSHQARQPVRPLDVLCEAKISAASPTFIKCSCEACTGGAAGYAGGNFNSVRDVLAHGQAVFGPETIVVLAELEMSWQVS